MTAPAEDVPFKIEQSGANYFLIRGPDWREWAVSVSRDSLISECENLNAAFADGEKKGFEKGLKYCPRGTTMADLQEKGLFGPLNRAS